MDEKLITSYQFGPLRGELRGKYDFPKNKDKESIHIPPFSTLEAPPKKIPKGKEARWDGEKWFLIDIPNETGT